jgi:hypothetical protein
MIFNSAFRLLAAFVAAVPLVSCDRGSAALQLAQSDPVWQRDSTLLTSKPALLLRVIRDSAAGRARRRVTPIATLNANGLRPLSMGDRGWRALDLAYLQSSATITPFRYGDPLPPQPLTRGMWEGAPFDTLPGCVSLAPSATVDVAADIELAFAGTPPKHRLVPELSDVERARILEDVMTLIAPTSGISMAQAAAYRRSVYTAATGAHATRTVVVVLTSAETQADTGVMMGQRPRQLIVVLDKGVYGYKPSYAFRDITDVQTSPQRRYLGHLDVDGDGVSELFFGLSDPKFPVVTYALRHENDTWREWWSYERALCHAARN